MLREFARSLWCPALALALAATRAAADSLSLLPVADTTLFQFAPTNNLGATANVLGGSTMNGTANRPLLRYDLSAIPAGATITNVTLTLTDVSGGTFQPSTFALHRLLVDWGEGNKTGNQGLPASTGEATWNARFHDLASWAAPGAAAGIDYAAVASGTTLVSTALGTNRYTFAATSAMVADAQLWLDTPGANFGWILISDGEGTAQTSRRFASHEDSQGRGPLLQIEFVPVPEPGTAGLLSLGILATVTVVTRRRRATQRMSAMKPTLLLLLALAVIPAARAETITLGASADASLFEYAPDNNMGGMLDLPSGTLGQVGTYRTRALFKFDVAAQIPADATIDSVSLTLEMNLQPPGASGSTFHLHRLLVDWGEGAGTGNRGRPALKDEVTWNNRFHDTVPWSAAGGEAGTDYVKDSSAGTYVGGYGPFIWMSTNLTADVQHWLDQPTENNGWILISEYEDYTYTAKRFGAREINDPAKRPQLKIEYTVIPEPATTALGALALAALAARRRAARR